MKKALCLVPVITLLFAVSGFAQLNAQTGPDNAPKVSEMAPDFQVSGGGRGAAPVSLKDYQGKKTSAFPSTSAPLWTRPRSVPAAPVLSDTASSIRSASSARPIVWPTAARWSSPRCAATVCSLSTLYASLWNG